MIERICIILLVSLVFFFKTLGYKYVSDDIPVSQRPKNWRNKWEKRLWQFNAFARISPLEDHALTMLIHSLVCVFIYLGFGKSDVSFIAALLFCFNPANNQGSVWISGRPYVLSTLGMVLAMSFPLIGPVFLLGGAYYNAGFVAPLAFIGSEYSWFLLFMPLIWMFHAKRFKANVGDKIKTEMFTEDKTFHPRKLILMTKTLGFYFVHGLIPIKTTFYHSFLQSAAGNEIMRKRCYSLCRFFWIGIITIIGIVSFWIFTPWSMASFGLLWWLVGIAPFLNLVRMTQEIAERFMYLPNVGLMFVLATVLQNNPVLSAVFISMYATKMWFYMDCYYDDFYIIEHACLNSPDSWFALHVRAIKRFEARSLNEAMIFWLMALSISPKEFKLLFNLALMSFIFRKMDKYKEYLDQAEQNIPMGQEVECLSKIKEIKDKIAEIQAGGQNVQLPILL